MAKNLRLWIIGSLLILVGILIVYAYFFLYVKCEDKQCFNNYLRDCNRAKFNSLGNMSFEYKILGASNGNCSVNVKLLRGDFTNQDSLKLQGKQMICNIPLGVVISPESDISLCHGLLKEGLQDLIISKLHQYIVLNLGDINRDIV